MSYIALNAAPRNPQDYVNNRLRRLSWTKQNLRRPWGLSLFPSDEFDEQAALLHDSAPDDSDEDNLNQILRLSCLPEEDFDKQTALLNESAFDDDDLRLVLSLSCLPPEVFDEQVAQMNSSLVVATPTEAQANPHLQYAFSPSQPSHEPIGPHTSGSSFQQVANLVGHGESSPRIFPAAASPNSRTTALLELSDIFGLDSLIDSALQVCASSGDNGVIAGLVRLSTSFHERFERSSKLSDLSAAVAIAELALDATPDGHADKASMLDNLGAFLQIRFGRLGELSDLDRAVKSHQRAVALTPDGHVKKASWLNNLGSSLRIRFDRLGELSDLDRAVESQQRAVALTPEGHADKAGRLSNLGASLGSRFGRLGELSDLDRAVESQQQAVTLTPDGHADKAQWLINLGGCLVSRYGHLRNQCDLVQAVSAYSQSAESRSSSPSTRFSAAKCWARICVSARSILHPGAAIGAYTVVLNLLPRLTSLGRTISQRYNDMSLANIGGVINEAVAEAICCGRLELAVEWLEQGRSIIWAQVLQLRSPIDDLRPEHPAEAERLETLSRALESAATSDSGSPRVPTTDIDVTLEEAAQKHRRLGEEYEKLLEHIRAFDGFGTFLKPKPFAELREAASSGPVVLVNSHQERCDALILHTSSHDSHSPPVLVTLPAMNSTIGEILQQELAESLRETGIQRRDRHCAQYDHDGSNTSSSGGHERCLSMLEQLWEKIAEPVLSHLGFLEKPMDGDLPHVTWCVTGPLAFLPIHAAGRYHEVNGPKVPDLVVSSYSPTLTALLNRKDCRADPPTCGIQVLGVSQPMTPGLSALPYTKVEIETIKHSCLGLRWLNDKDATKDAVIRHMKKCNWIHFACHGTQNGTESAFHLADGKLTLQDIMKNSLPHAELAVLSACQTAMGDEQLPEEALHLAAGMLMAGYNSVVATMWSIADSDGPIVAKEFYRYLMDEGRGDSTKSAYALHHAVKRLREEVGETNFTRWVPFIHLGI